MSKLLAEHAERLASDSRLKRVLEAARNQNRDQYLRELDRCDFWHAKERQKRVARILDHDYKEADSSVA
jgi:hypothetical protein